MDASPDELRSRVDALTTELERAQSTLKLLAQSTPLEFSVMQYNLLAKYLGSNLEPWFLFGANLDEERRARVQAKHVEKDADGRYLNVGFEKYTAGVLTEEEQAAVRKVDEECFAWERRGPLLCSTIWKHGADVISLVECDEFEYFKKYLGPRGYDGRWRKRPRRSSPDGCAIFWRTAVFELVHEAGIDFVDGTHPTRGEIKDRCAQLVLLRSASHREQLVCVCSIHLARNPEDPKMDLVRARQVAQLFRWMDETLRASGVDGASDAAVVWCGDLNASKFQDLRGLVLSLSQILRGADDEEAAAARRAERQDARQRRSQLGRIDDDDAGDAGDESLGGSATHDMSSFLWDAVDVPSRATSVTEARNVRIDAIFYSGSQMRLVDAPMLPALRAPIPDARHPSDHLPVVARLRLTGDLDRAMLVARAWFNAVGGLSLGFCEEMPPLTRDELDVAWTYFDWSCEGTLTLPKLRRVASLAGIQVSLDRIERIFENVLAGGESSLARFSSSDRSSDVSGRSRMRIDTGGLSLSNRVTRSASEEQFIQVYERSLAEERQLCMPHLLAAWKTFEHDDDGVVTVGEILTKLEQITPFPLDHEKCLHFFDARAVDASKITFEKFAQRIIHHGRQRRQSTTHEEHVLPPTPGPVVEALFGVPEED